MSSSEPASAQATNPTYGSTPNPTSTSPKRSLDYLFQFGDNNTNTIPKKDHSYDKSLLASSTVLSSSQLRLSRYFSRRGNPTAGTHLQLSPGRDEKFVGIFSPVAVVWGVIFLIIPAAYVYIVLVLLRELCRLFPQTVLALCLQQYASWLINIVTILQKHAASPWVEVWCVLEACFYLGLKLHIKWLQTRDPLEASLSAAPMMELSDRRVLWQRMLACEQDDPVTFLRGWFFDQPLENISKYDIRDFITWSMFEGRHQEHLTDEELRQLEEFVDEAEQRISLHLYGERSEEENDEDGAIDIELDRDPADAWKGDIFQKMPKQRFVFTEQAVHEESNYFSDFYESYRKTYEENMKAMRNATADFKAVQELRNMVHDATADYQPVQRMRDLMAETGKHLEMAEETALRSATRVYESLVPAGSDREKQIAAMSHATSQQMAEAWNSVKNMRESLEMARLLKRQRRRIRQQLKGYRELLKQMRRMSTGIPSKQMASMMRRITECNERMELIEQRAKTSFVRASGLALQKLPFLMQRAEPVRFARYSSDPLLGIATYPLGFHALVFCLSEVPLRILMYRRGFERRIIGSVGYYYHPGPEDNTDADLDFDKSLDNDEAKTPIVFVHGIGLGLLPYLPLIDSLVATGRPLLLPEIPYVSGFRPFQSIYGVLSPPVVCSTMTAMLASHGFLKACWMGHSYGTSWLSYMCKFSPNTVSALLFLDPICFCLHVPYLTKQFVYMLPDPGTVSYMVRTDVMVNWTIQRSFPWAWVVLFTEQINVPCTVFLSENDALVPAKKVEEYLKTKNIPLRDFDQCTENYFYYGSDEDVSSFSNTKCDSECGDDSTVLTEVGINCKQDDNILCESSTHSNLMTCVLFRGDGHGEWTDRASATVPMIVKAAEALCRKAEKQHEKDE